MGKQGYEAQIPNAGPRQIGCTQDARDGCTPASQQKPEREVDYKRLLRELCAEREARAAAEGRALTATDEAAAAVSMHQLDLW